MRTLLALMLLLAFAFASAAAAERYALVIGNDAYQHVTPLRKAVADARAYKRHLEQERGFDRVIYAENADEDEMAGAIASFLAAVGEGDVALVVYSGHGAQLDSAREDTLFLLPVDVPALDAQDLGAAYRLQRAAISFSALRQQLKDRGAATRVYVLDACRDNPFETADGIANQVQGEVLALAEREADFIQEPWYQDGVPNKTCIDERCGVRVEPPVCADETALWLLAEADGDCGGYEAFLEACPSAVRAPFARNRTRGLECDVVANTNAPPLIPESRNAVETPDMGSFQECDHCPEMIVIPAGPFLMGSDRGPIDEKPVHLVLVPRFAIGRTEVTFDQWDACSAEGYCRTVDNNPGWGRCDRPVIYVSWQDITGEGGSERGFLAWLNSKVEGAPYRPPSEAEWEYAARAGSTAAYSYGDGESRPVRYAWFGENSDSKTHPVAHKRANKFGLYDVHGNVAEQVKDCWHSSYTGAPLDGSHWMSSHEGDFSKTVIRGGDWYASTWNLRSASRRGSLRDIRNSQLGFRVVRTSSR